MKKPNIKIILGAPSGPRNSDPKKRFCTLKIQLNGVYKHREYIIWEIGMAISEFMADQIFNIKAMEYDEEKVEWFIKIVNRES